MLRTAPVSETGVAAAAEDLTILWLLVCAYLVFFMQCGFALFEAGAVRLKNVKNILLKNVIDACISAAAWWACGYAFAYGQCGDNAFIGTTNFFLANSDASADTAQGRKLFAHFMFSWAFSATATTIVGGAIAERTRFRAYVMYTAVMNAWVYPVAVHWVWSESGWLSTRRHACAGPLSPGGGGGGDKWEDFYSPLFAGTNGLLDFAGSSVVHLAGGAASLCGVAVLGPRTGRFSADGRVVDFPCNSPAEMMLGVFILWFGWYGFNTGSTGCMLGCMYTASKVAVNTTLSAGSGGLTVLLLTLFAGNPGDIGPILNGILVGLVASTGACAFVQSYAAVVIGIVAGVLYVAGSKSMRRLGLDDVVDAAPVHLLGGLWGVVSAGLFATETSVRQTYGYADGWGIFYGGPWKQLGVQVLGAVAVLAWALAFMWPMFALLRHMGWLRVSKEEEENGLDFSQSIGTGVSLLDPRMWRWQPWARRRHKAAEVQ